MTHDARIEQLLRWRLARAAADAPPPPRAADLLASARPWWERWPERFGAYAERLRAMPTAYGYAMVAPAPQGGRAGYPVPVLIAGAHDAGAHDAEAHDVEAYARVLYLAVRDGRLRLRFALDGETVGASAAGQGEPAFEATLVDDAPHAERPLCAARAERSQSGEYRVDVALPADVAGRWAPLKVTDRMPFRLILRPVADGE